MCVTCPGPALLTRHFIRRMSAPAAIKPWVSENAKASPKRLVWHDDEHLQIGDLNLVLSLDEETIHRTQSTPDQLVLVKNRWLVEDNLARMPQRVDYMVELGIFKGGSIAFFEAWYAPIRLVGLDIRSERVAALDTYLERQSASERVKLYYDTDQRDRDALQRIAQENFEGRFLDVVVDDGAHRYQASKTSLNVFLPLVRPGGLYVIEDWAWAHWPGICHQENAASGDYADQVHPLTKLVFEAVMVTASRPDVISDVYVDGSRAFLRRGAADIDPADFDLSSAYLTSLWATEFELSHGIARDRDCREPTRLLKLWRDWVPPSIRTRVPPSLASLAHRWTSSPRRVRDHSTVEAPFGGHSAPES